jgi:PAS domain S-box-containing protein
MQNEQLRRSQKDTAEEHRKYTDLYDFAPVGYFTFDKKGNIIETNVTGASLLGSEKRSLKGQPFHRFITPGHFSIFQSHLQRALEIQSKQSCKLKLTRKDGSLFDALIDTIAVMDGDGNFDHYRSSVTDITEITKAEEGERLLWEAKRAETQLFEANQRLQALMQAVPVGVSFSDDATCQRITGNHAMLEQFEVRPEDNLSASAPDNRAPGRQVRFFRNGRQMSDAELPLQRAVAENMVIPSMELEVKLPSGRSWFAEASGAPVRDAQGNVIAGLVVTVDISERKRAKEELQRERDFTDKVLSVAGALVIVLDSEGRIIRFNHACEQVTGYAFDEVRGRPFWDLFILPEELQGAKDTFADLRGGQSPIQYENHCVAKDGSRRLIRWSNTAMISSSGTAKYVIGTGIDITDREQAEDALRERTIELEAVNRELESFSYSVSHDLRAPLRAIDGYARLILKKQGDKFDADTLDKFNVIRSSTHLMGQLIDDLLTFSRLGRKQMSLALLDMDILMKDAWKELQAIEPEKNVKLTVNNMPPGHGDRALIKQVLINLLSNAMKFTKYKDVANIEVGGCTNGNERVYYVRDNGVGFDMAYYDKLFGVFQRLHSTDQFEGTGVGLATVQRIIHRHSGRVWAEGKVDEGACFYFALNMKE